MIQPHTLPAAAASAEGVGGASGSRPLRLATALLLCCLAPALAALDPGDTLVPDNIFYLQLPNSSVLSVLAQGVELEGDLLGSATASTAAQCAQACYDNPECQLFGHATGTDCKTGQADACGDCRFYSLGCTLVPVVANSSRLTDSGSESLTGGFPVRYELDDLPGFTAQAGQGVPGADISCPGSLIPGKCAMSSTTDAVVLCIRTPDCAAVVHYFKGLDGCSEPVSLLVHDSLTQSGAFLSPTVATLSRIDTGSLRETTLMASDNATVVLPPAEELPAGDAAISNTTWLGCIIAPNVLMAGDVVEVLSGVPTAEECCRRCRGDMRCNLFNYCEEPRGCTFSWGPRTLSLEQGQCELRFNEPVSLVGGGFPPAVIDKGPSVPFVGGAPLAVLAPPVPGFAALPGRNQFQFDGGSFNCSFTINPTSQECVVEGPPEYLGNTCRETPECAGLLMLAHAEGPPTGVLKSVIDTTSIGLSPTNALYIRNDTTSSGGGGGKGSTGAIVGIAVGCTAAVAAVAAAAWVLLHRRRRAISAGGAELGKRVSSGDEAGLAEGGQLREDSSSAHGGGSAVPTRLHGTAPRSGDTTTSVALSDGSWNMSSGGLSGGPTTKPFAGRSIRHPSDGPPAGPSSSRPISPFSGGPQHSAGAAPATSPFTAGPYRSTQPGSAHPASPFAGGPHSSGGIAPARSIPARGSAGSIAAAGSGSGPAAALSGAASGQPIAAFTLASPQGSRTAASPFAAARARAAAQGHTPTGGGPAQGGSAAATPALTPTMSHMSAASARSGMASGPSSSSTVATSASNVLPELAAHVANQDAGAQQSMGFGAAASSDTAGGELLSEVSLLSPAALSPGLRDWLVDLQEIEFVRWPNGAFKELGQGASATVYSVLYRGEEVAAKQVEIGRSAAMQELFVKEAERLHQLRHAHVVGLYGVVLSGSQGLLLMEYCSGRDLHSALALKAAGTDERLFGWYGRGRRVAADIAKGINFLHSKACVHMDIKSSNVLLTGGGTAKLADVGLARLQQNTHISGMEAKAVGTFAWMAPEVIMGSRCTSAVDIFSFGVVLWEIVTGEQPMRGEMRLPRVPEECPQEAAELINRCMSLDAGQRPTAQQIMRELEAMKGKGRH